jgi:hypothetical protein
MLFPLRRLLPRTCCSLLNVFAFKSTYFVTPHSSPLSHLFGAPEARSGFVRLGNSLGLAQIIPHGLLLGRRVDIRCPCATELDRKHVGIDVGQQLREIPYHPDCLLQVLSKPEQGGENEMRASKPTTSNRGSSFMYWQTGNGEEE